MRIEALTFFRFFAALTVVFFHFGRGLFANDAYTRFQSLGPEMVTFFFALSGFVMMMAAARKPDQTAGQYYRARFARIYPIYFVALLWALFLFEGQVFSRGYGLNDAKAIVLNLTLLQSWIPPYALSLNDPGWSLSVEAFFYLAFPAVLLLVRRSEVKPLHLFIIVFLLYAMTQVILSSLLFPRFYRGFPSLVHDLVFYFPLGHFCSFLLGVAAGHLFTSRRDSFGQPGARAGVFFGGSLALLSTILYFQPEMVAKSPVPVAFDASFYSPLFTLFILSTAYSDNIVTRGLSWRPLVVLGNASYDLYILQKPVFWVYHRNLGAHVSERADVRFGVFLLLLVALSIAAHYLVELPAQRGLIRIMEGRKGASIQRA